MFTLYTSSTPNGYKASIMLEELGVPYKVHPISLSKLEQKEPWFLDINPNGRIPALVDHDADDFAVFESGAILVYLAEKFGKLLPDDAKGRSIAIQWLMFQMGGVGPMQGQANVFFRYAPETIPYAIARYQKETRRLYEVLERRLQEADYLAGEYSIADIAMWPWVSVYAWAGVSVDGLDALQAWLERVGAREGVQRGITIPEPLVLKDEEDEQKQAKSASSILV